MFGVKEANEGEFSNKQDQKQEIEKFEGEAMFKPNGEESSMKSLNEALYNFKKWESEREYINVEGSENLRKVQQLAKHITELRRQQFNEVKAEQ